MAYVAAYITCHMLHHWMFINNFYRYYTDHIIMLNMQLCNSLSYHEGMKAAPDYYFMYIKTIKIVYFPHSVTENFNAYDISGSKKGRTHL